MNIRVLDKTKIRSYITEARPAEKSNEILEIDIDGAVFRCERPWYCYKKFDIEIYKSGFEREGYIIYGKKIPVFFDQKGRWWCREEFSSKGMMKFFIDNPGKYIEVMSNKVKDSKKLIEMAKKLEKTINSDDRKVIVQNMKELKELFTIFFSYHFITYVLFDDLIFKFRELLMKHLPKKLANTYMCEFLRANITKEAIKAGAVSEVRGQRDTTYSKDKPIIFYREPTLFSESKLDNEVMGKIMVSANEETIKEFVSLRMIAPLAIQMSEDAQYLESKTFCPMMSIVVGKIAKIFLNEGIIKTEEQIKDFSPDEMIEIIENIDEERLSDYDHYVKSVHGAIGNMHLGTLQPYDWFQAHPLHANEFLTHLKCFVRRAKQLKLSSKQLAECWGSVSSLRCLLYYTIIDMKAVRMPRHERIMLSNFIFDMVKTRMKADLFNFNSNIIRTDDEINKLIKTIRPVKANPNKARLMGKLYNALYNLGAATNLDIYLDHSIEAEGPYDVSHIYGLGHILVIRKLIDLQVPDIWPGRKEIKPGNVFIYTIYNGNVKFSTDFISAHTVFNGDTINNMKHFMIEVDGKFVSSEDELNELLKLSEDQSIEQWNILMDMDIEQHKIKGMESRCLALKNMFELVGLDWRPTEEMINAVKGKPYKDNSFWKFPEDPIKKDKFLKKLYDPREDFFAGDSVN